MASFHQSLSPKRRCELLGITDLSQQMEAKHAEDKNEDRQEIKQSFPDTAPEGPGNKEIPLPVGFSMRYTLTQFGEVSDQV